MMLTRPKVEIEDICFTLDNIYPTSLDYSRLVLMVLDFLWIYDQIGEVSHEKMSVVLDILPKVKIYDQYSYKEKERKFRIIIQGLSVEIIIFVVSRVKMLSDIEVRSKLETWDKMVDMYEHMENIPH